MKSKKELYIKVKEVITKNPKITSKIIKYVTIQIMINYNVGNYIYTYLNEMGGSALVFIVFSFATIVIIKTVYESNEPERIKEDIKKTEDYQEMIENNELMEPLKVIKIYQEYKAIWTTFDYVVCISLGLFCLNSSYAGFREYLLAVKLYKEMKNQSREIEEWREDGNQ